MPIHTCHTAQNGNGYSSPARGVGSNVSICAVASSSSRACRHPYPAASSRRRQRGRDANGPRGGKPCVDEDPATRRRSHLGRTVSHRGLNPREIYARRESNPLPRLTGPSLLRRRRDVVMIGSRLAAMAAQTLMCESDDVFGQSGGRRFADQNRPIAARHQ